MACLANDQTAILDETLPNTVSLFDLARATPLSWEVQRGRVVGTDSLTQSPRCACRRTDYGIVIPSASAV